MLVLVVTSTGPSHGHDGRTLATLSSIAIRWNVAVLPTLHTHQLWRQALY
jgi:hypothetical protein